MWAYPTAEGKQPHRKRKEMHLLKRNKETQLLPASSGSPFHERGSISHSLTRAEKETSSPLSLKEALFFRSIQPYIHTHLYTSLTESTHCSLAFSVEESLLAFFPINEILPLSTGDWHTECWSQTSLNSFIQPLFIKHVLYARCCSRPCGYSSEPGKQRLLLHGT